MLKHNQKGSVNLLNNQSSYETSQPGKDFTRVHSFLSKIRKTTTTETGWHSHPVTYFEHSHPVTYFERRITFCNRPLKQIL